MGSTVHLVTLFSICSRHLVVYCSVLGFCLRNARRRPARTTTSSASASLPHSLGGGPYTYPPCRSLSSVPVGKIFYDDFCARDSERLFSLQLHTFDYLFDTHFLLSLTQPTMAQLSAFDVSTRARRLRCQPGFPKVPARFMGTCCGIEHLDTFINEPFYNGSDLAYDATNVNKFAIQLRDLKNKSKIISVERNITFDELRKKLPKSHSKLQHKYIENPCHFFVKTPSGVYEEPDYQAVIDHW